MQVSRAAEALTTNGTVYRIDLIFDVERNINHLKPVQRHAAREAIMLLQAGLEA